MIGQSAAATDLLTVAETETALAPARRRSLRPRGDAFVQLVERLATNPDVDVQKLEKLIEMQERILRVNAEAAFNAAYAVMQPELPFIAENGSIKNRDGSVRSKYATLEDIQQATKPIMAKHGFAIRHRTEWPVDGSGIIRIVGILTHRDGHREETAFEAPADKSEYRTDVQSQGSTISYGRRYTTIELLNIETRGTDNDGATAGRPQPPEGYEAWIAALESVAPNGLRDLEESFGKSKTEYKNFIVKHDKDRYAAMKEKARGVRK